MNHQGAALAAQEGFRVNAIFNLLVGEFITAEEFEVFSKSPGVERGRHVLGNELLFPVRPGFKAEDAFFAFVFVGDRLQLGRIFPLRREIGFLFRRFDDHMSAVSLPVAPVAAA